MTLLVTGGTGFLGSYLVRHALMHGGEDRVVVLEKHVDRSKICDVLDRVTIVEGDVADHQLLRGTIERHGIDRIAHFAFILGSPSPGNMLPWVNVQCDGTANVLESARLAGVKRVLFASSVAAYGKQDAAVLSEDLVPNPQDPYGAAKRWAECLADHYATHLDLETVTLRFGSTYGLGRGWRGSYSSGLLRPPATLHYMARIEQAARGEAIEMPNGVTLADFTYAGDAAQAALLALTKPALSWRLYNVSSDRLPIAAYIQAMRQLLPAATITESASENPGNPHAPMDNTRLVSDLGFAPAFDLKAGLADYLERIAMSGAYAE